MIKKERGNLDGVDLLCEGGKIFYVRLKRLKNVLKELNIFIHS